MLLRSWLCFSLAVSGIAIWASYWLLASEPQTDCEEPFNPYLLVTITAAHLHFFTNRPHAPAAYTEHEIASRDGTALTPHQEELANHYNLARELSLAELDSKGSAQLQNIVKKYQGYFKAHPKAKTKLKKALRVHSEILAEVVSGISTHAGSCGTHASLNALLSFTQKTPPKRIEIIHSKHPDRPNGSGHMMVVFNRSPHSKLKKPGTWSQDETASSPLYVVDTWMGGRNVYTAENLPVLLFSKQRRLSVHSNFTLPRLPKASSELIQQVREAFQQVCIAAFTQLEGFDSGEAFLSEVEPRPNICLRI